MTDGIEIINRIYHITIDGETRTLKSWCKIKRRRYLLVYRRIREGWPISKAFNKPRRRAKGTPKGQNCSSCHCDYLGKEFKRIPHKNGAVTRSDWETFHAGWCQVFHL